MVDGRAPSRRVRVSCEQCRGRKIKCPRDGPPCSSCVRRRVSQCVYLSGNHSAEANVPGRSYAEPSSFHTHPVPSARTGSPELTTALRSPLSSSAPRTDQDSCDIASQHHRSTENLTKRVQRLEQLLQDQSRAPGIPPVPDNVDFNPCTPRSRAPDQHQRRVVGGVLKKAASGHVRFVPKSQRWRHEADAGSDSSHYSPSPRPSPQQTSLKELLVRLPPVTQCSELVNVYFRSFASLFHILHDPTFTRQYDSFLEDPETSSLSWLALLYAVLSTAVLALERTHPLLSDLSRTRRCQRLSDLMDQYRSAAMACLDADNYLWNHNVTTLQALILLIYSIGHSHGRTWTLLGLAHHLAISLGCHVDPSEFDLSAVECEERRRCWAGLMMLYTSENLSLGYGALAHHVLPTNCSAPSDIDDDQIGRETSRPYTPNQATQMTYLLLKFRLYDICADLCERVLNLAEPPPYYIIKELDGMIENEKTSWNLRYHQNGSSLTRELPEHHKAHLKILQSYASHLTLLLHQAALETEQSYGPTAPEWSETKIVTSALHLLEIHAEFEQDPALVPFGWYNRGLGSFHAFHAATLLFSSRWSTSGRRRIDEIHEALRNCAVRFEGLYNGATSDLNSHFSRTTPVLHHLW